MIQFEIISNGETTETMIARLQKDFPLSKISKQVQDDIIDETKKRGWKRIANTIKRKIISSNEHHIYLGGKDKDISIYLHSGTKSHFISPRKKKALSWLQGGVRYFSKGHSVRGIKATGFFKIYDSTLTKITAIVDKHFK